MSTLLLADGNSRAARSARANRQLRDGDGQWIEMGGGAHFKVPKPGAPDGGTWYQGTVVGIDPQSRKAKIKLSNGQIATVPSHLIHRAKAILPEDVQTKPKSPSPPPVSKLKAKGKKPAKIKRGEMTLADVPDDVVFPDHGRTQPGFHVATPQDYVDLFNRNGQRIAPKWTDVIVADEVYDPKTHANYRQVIASDSLKRDQGFYAPGWRAYKDEIKFRRATALTKALPQIRERITKDFASNPSAGALALQLVLGIRTGSATERPTLKGHTAIGASTMRAKGVHIDGDTVSFDYVGKSNVRAQLKTTDPLIHAVMSHYLQGKSGDDRLFQVSEKGVGTYFTQMQDDRSMNFDHSAGAFTPKDFRTVHAGAIAMKMLSEMDIPPRLTEAQYQAIRRQIADRVAQFLNNTPTVALKSYIPHSVWDALLALLEPGSPSLDPGEDDGESDDSGGTDEGGGIFAAIEPEAEAKTEPQDEPKVMVPLPDDELVRLWALIPDPGVDLAQYGPLDPAAVYEDVDESEIEEVEDPESFLTAAAPVPPRPVRRQRRVQIPGGVDRVLSRMVKEHNARVATYDRVRLPVVRAVYARGINSFSLERNPGMTRDGYAFRRVDDFLAGISSQRLTLAQSRYVKDLQDADLLPRRALLESSRPSLTRTLSSLRASGADDLVRLLVSVAPLSPLDVRRRFTISRVVAAARVGGSTTALSLPALEALLADGNSRAARSARAKRQLRDRFGKWIEMGGGIRFKLRSPGAPGGGVWYHGTAVGVDVPNGLVHVKLDDGRIISAPANKVEKTIATLPSADDPPEANDAPAIDVTDAPDIDEPSNTVESRTSADELRAAAEDAHTQAASRSQDTDQLDEVHERVLDHLKLLDKDPKRARDNLRSESEDLDRSGDPVLKAYAEDIDDIANAINQDDSEQPKARLGEDNTTEGDVPDLTQAEEAIAQIEQAIPDDSAAARVRDEIVGRLEGLLTELKDSSNPDTLRGDLGELIDSIDAIKANDDSLNPDEKNALGDLAEVVDAVAQKIPDSPSAPANDGSGDDEIIFEDDPDADTPSEGETPELPEDTPVEPAPEIETTPEPSKDTPGDVEVTTPSNNASPETLQDIAQNLHDYGGQLANDKTSAELAKEVKDLRNLVVTVKNRLGDGRMERPEAAEWLQEASDQINVLHQTYEINDDLTDIQDRIDLALRDLLEPQDEDIADVEVPDAESDVDEADVEQAELPDDITSLDQFNSPVPDGFELVNEHQIGNKTAQDFESDRGIVTVSSTPVPLDLDSGEVIQRGDPVYIAKTKNAMPIGNFSTFDDADRALSEVKAAPEFPLDDAPEVTETKRVDANATRVENNLDNADRPVPEGWSVVADVLDGELTIYGPDGLVAFSSEDGTLSIARKTLGSYEEIGDFPDWESAQAKLDAPEELNVPEGRNPELYAPLKGFGFSEERIAAIRDMENKRSVNMEVQNAPEMREARERYRELMDKGFLDLSDDETAEIQKFVDLQMAIDHVRPPERAPEPPTPLPPRRERTEEERNRDPWAPDPVVEPAPAPEAETPEAKAPEAKIPEAEGDVDLAKAIEDEPNLDPADKRTLAQAIDIAIAAIDDDDFPQAIEALDTALDLLGTMGNDHEPLFEKIRGIRNGIPQDSVRAPVPEVDQPVDEPAGDGRFDGANAEVDWNDEPIVLTPVEVPRPAGAAAGDERRYVAEGVITGSDGKEIYRGLRVESSRGEAGTVSRVQQEPPYARVDFDDGRTLVRSARQLQVIDYAKDDDNRSVDPVPVPDEAPAAPTPAPDEAPAAPTPDEAPAPAPSPPVAPMATPQLLPATIDNGAATPTAEQIGISRAPGLNYNGETPGVTTNKDALTRGEFAKDNSYTPLNFADWGDRAAEIAAAANERPDLAKIQNALREDGLDEAALQAAAAAFGHGDAYRFGSRNYQVQVVQAEVTSDLGYLAITANVLDEDGNKVGTLKNSIRSITKNDPANSVNFDRIKLEPSARGSGFAAAFTRHMENWYVANDIDSVHIEAVGDDSLNGYNGSYTWAINGYDWLIGPTEVTQRIRELPAVVEKFADVPGIQDELKELQDAIANGAVPPPYQFAMFGYRPGATNWAGRQYMAHESNPWYGVKKLNPGSRSSQIINDNGQFLAARERAKAGVNAISAPSIATLIEANTFGDSRTRAALAPHAAEANRVLSQGASLAELSPEAKNALKNAVRSEFLNPKRTVDGDEIIKVMRGLQSEYRLDHPDNVQMGPVAEIQAISWSDIQNQNTPGFTTVGAKEAGYAEGYNVRQARGKLDAMFRMTHDATGQQFVVKYDALRQYKEDPINTSREQEAWMLEFFRNASMHGTSFAVDHPEPGVIIQQTAGDAVELKARPENAADFSPAERKIALANLANPDDFLKITMADALFSQKDRHEKNFQLAQDRNSQWWIFPIDNSISGENSLKQGFYNLEEKLSSGKSAQDAVQESLTETANRRWSKATIKELIARLGPEQAIRVLASMFEEYESVLNKMEADPEMKRRILFALSHLKTDEYLQAILRFYR